VHFLHFKYDYQAAILEKPTITPELMAGSTPNVNHRYIYLLGIFYGFFTRGEPWPFHFIDRIMHLFRFCHLVVLVAIYVYSYIKKNTR
jgi:hypothetical protein